MELKEFISAALMQIVEGVAAVQAPAEALGALINPEDVLTTHFGAKGHSPSIEARGRGRRKRFVQFIEFDVAVVVTRDEKMKGSGGLLNVVSAGLESSHAQQTTTRIKFSVPLTLPLHGEELTGSGWKRQNADQGRTRSDPPPQPPSPPGPSP